MAEERRKILEVRDVKKYFPLGKGRLKEGRLVSRRLTGSRLTYMKARPSALSASRAAANLH